MNKCLILVCFLFCSCNHAQKSPVKNALAVKALTKPPQDTVKIDYGFKFPSPRLVLEYYNKYLGDTNLVKKRDSHIEVLKINVLYKANKNIKFEYYRIDSINRRADYKVLYTFDKKDSLALNAQVSSVSYNGDFYIVFFPKLDEWGDFTPPEDDKGYFQYTPLAFRLDTINNTLLKMKYNPLLAIPRSEKNHKVIIYNDGPGHYSFQWDRYFSFSKNRNEFVFGKRLPHPEEY